MNEAFRKKIDDKLSAFRMWNQGKKFDRCRLVQYCGPVTPQAADVPANEIERQIHGLMEEGFYVEWKCKSECIYLKVWEHGYAEPDWKDVFEETWSDH